MLIIEVIFLLISLASVLIFSFLSLLSLLKNRPIKEISLVYVASVFLILTFLLYLVIPLNTYPNTPIDKSLIIFDQLGFVTSQITLLIISYAFILPDFRPTTYNSLSLMNSITIISITNLVYNSITIQTKVDGNILHTSYDSVGTLLIISFYVLLSFVLFRRIKNVFEILEKKRKSPITSVPSIIIFGFLVILNITIYLISRFVYPDLPTYFPYVFLNLLFLYVGFAVYLDPAFFFITRSSLDFIIIVDKKSGLPLQSVTFIDNVPEEMVSSIFSLLNISLKELIQIEKSEENLTEIVFGKKPVLISHGEYISSIMVLSEANFLTRAISKYLVSKFEKKYVEKLKNFSTKGGINTNDFKEFQETFKFVRRFIPL